MRTYQKALGLGLILIITGSPISCGNDAPKPGTTCLKDGEQPVEGQCYDANGCPCQHGTGASSGNGGAGNGGTTSGSGGTGASSGSGGNGAGNGGSTTGGSGGTGASSGNGGSGGGSGMNGDPCAYDADCASHACCSGFCVDKTSNENHCGACEHNCNGGTCISGVCNGGSGGGGTGGSSGTGGSGTGGSGTGGSSGSGGSNGGPGDPCTNDNECIGLSCCGGHCTSKNSDEQNCGTCGNVCNAATVCQAGQCLPCVAPTVNCTTFCADFSSNVSCGGCNIQCVGGQTCQPAPSPIFHACQ